MDKPASSTAKCHTLLPQGILIMKPPIKYQAAPLPNAATKWFKQKKLKPSFNWQEVWQAEHVAAFTVAKATQMDILTTLHQAVTESAAKGKSFASFQKDLKPQLEKLGWWGKKEVIDPRTGEIINAQLGSPRRLRTIYDANMRSAYNAGRWQNIQRGKKTHPYLIYELGPSREHRLEHQAWAGVCLSVDDPWWQTHYPRNGWGCKCRVRRVTQAQHVKLKNDKFIMGQGEPILKNGLATGRFERKKIKVSFKAPPLNMMPWKNTRTGEMIDVPKGIDAGWANNVGMARLEPITQKISASAGELLKSQMGNSAFKQTLNAALAALKQRNNNDRHGLTDSELVALRLYTAVGVNINTDARQGNGRYEPHLWLIQTGLDKLPIYKGMVLRGENIESKRLKQYKIGETVTIPQFYSSSYQDGWQKTTNTHFTIKAKTGRKIDILASMQQETEVLFSVGTQFLVTRRRTIGGKHFIELKEITDGDTNL